MWDGERRKREFEEREKKTHRGDEAGGNTLERGRVEDATGAFLVSHESGREVRLFFCADSHFLQLGRDGTALVF